MKVIFLKKCYDSASRTTYEEGHVYDLSPELAELMKGKANDHYEVLPTTEPEEKAEAPKRGRPKAAPVEE